MKIFTKKFLGIILSVLMLMPYALTGCANSSQTTASDNSKKIVVTDGIGRKVELDKKVDKVLTNDPISTQLVFALGASDELVGMDGKTIKEPFATKINTKGSKNSNTFNVESAASVNPGLVLISVKNKNLVDTIQKHGLKVFVVNAESIDELKDTVKNIGKALGKEDKANEFTKYYDTTIAAMKDRTKNLKDSEKPKVYFAGADLFSTCGKDMYQNYIITLAGGKNVGEGLRGRWSKVSVEQVVSWNPDVILLAQYAGTKPEDVLNNPSLQGVNAVKNKKVYLFPSKIYPWDMPAPLAILGIEWTGKKINPDSFKDIDMQKESEKVFKNFYNKNFSDYGETLN